MWVQASASKQQHGADAIEAKAELRRLALDHVDPASVLDAFCGDGGMWRAVWNRAANYVGCDLKWWTPETEFRRYVADNVRLMRAIDLQQFNIFDLDAYGSPWELGLILAARRKWASGEVGAVILTDGTDQKTRFGQLPKAMAELCGIGHADAPTGCETGVALQALALTCLLDRMGVRKTHQWEARGKGSGKGDMRMVYTCVVFVGK